ncbi:MAG: GTPase [Patescibacteria group bacterium]|nr:50S ribosome-binding GTPase [Patescibacteria group bacterium]
MQKDVIKKIVFKKVEKLEQEIRETPYHKGTEHYLGLLKAKAAKLKRELGEKEEKSSKGGAGYGVRKQGDASCILIGPPSAGKSTLLNAITNAKSKVGDYGFTTLNVIPGMMFYQGARIQILDVPGLVTGAAKGKGGGRKILSTARSADLVLLITDTERIDWFEKAKEELYQNGVRLDLSKPKIKVVKKTRGGIEIIDPFSSFNRETVISVALEFGLKNAQISFGEPINSIDEMIDVFAENRAYLPCLELVSKADRLAKKAKTLDQRIFVSGVSGEGLDRLKKEIWQSLGLIRIYLKKERTKEPDFGEPLILKKGGRIEDITAKVSSELTERRTAALIWGPGAKFPGQKVSLKHPVFDQMIVSLVE